MCWKLSTDTVTVTPDSSDLFTNTVTVNGVAVGTGATCSATDSVDVVRLPTTGGGGGQVQPKKNELDLKDDKKVKWELENTGSADVLLTSIEVEFPSQHDELKKVKLNGDVAKNVDESSPVFLDVNDFESDSKKRRIDAGKKEKLELEFKDKFKDHEQSDFVIILTFNNGQTLTFDRGRCNLNTITSNQKLRLSAGSSRGSPLLFRCS